MSRSSVTRLLLIRHGETDWNVQHRLQGTSDIPLNDVGRAQARAVAPRLARLAAVDTIVASDLSRAVETAQIIADAMGARVVTDARLRERCYGVWEGLDQEVREADHADEHRRWVVGLEPEVEGYERNAAVRDRAIGAIEDIAGEGGTHLLVTHGSTARIAVAELLGAELGSHAVGNLGNAQWAELAREGEGHWVLRSLNTQSDAVDW